jgi:thiamine kinase-like enzyme
MRYVEVVYGPPEDKHAMLIYGGDIWVELEPRKWARLCDLPESHPANQLLAKGGLQATVFVDGSGQQITRLNAYNPEHRKIAAEQGLFINVPYNPDKREEILKTLEKIREELQVLTESRFIDLRNRINRIKTRLEVLKGIRSLEREIAEKEKLQATWDSTINDAANMLEEAVKLSNMIFPTNYEKLAFQEAVKRAKREAVLEAAIEESLLLNPSLLRDLRRRLLED